MPAKRKFVRDSNGVEVHGLSFHKSSGQYYSLDEATGKRTHHGVQLNAAIKSFKHVDAALVADIADLRKGIFQGAKTQLEAALQWVPAEPQLKAALGALTTTPDAPPPPSTQKLSDCYADWEKWSTAQVQQKEDTKRHFDLFVKTVGDLPINQLTSDHFKAYRYAIETKNKTFPPSKKKIKRKPQKLSIKAKRDYHKSVAKVFKFAKRNNRAWSFPAGILEWCGDWKILDTTPYVPKESNKTPISPEDFHKCLALVNEWKQIDPSAPATSTVERGEKRQDQIRLRDGYQWDVLLRLAINCSLGNKDCAEIEWSNLKLDAAIPHLDYPRTKVKHKTGFAIPRKIPLIKSTLEAIERWVPFKNGSKMFLTSKGTPYNKGTIGDRFDSIVKQAETKGAWTFKHVRNVASSVGRTAKISKDERQAILGHVCEGTNKHYEGEEIDESFLINCVEVVKMRYGL